MGSNETHLFFPTIMRERHIEKAADLNKKIMVGVEKTKNNEPNTIPVSWSCDLYTTMGSPTTLLEHKEYKPLRNVFMHELNEFARDLNLNIDQYPLRITDCWLNVYGEGHAQEIHNHANSVISGIYYVKAPKGSGDLVIESPYADSMFSVPVIQNVGLNLMYINVRPQEGMMILFRSFVKHSVKPNRIKEERISIAFNATMDVLG